MNRSGATIAIVATRLSKERRVLLVACAACGLLAYLQRYDDDTVRLAGCLVFGSLAGITIALLQRGAGRFRELEICEQSAPLYGRELARATALVPFVIVSIALAAYWLVGAVYAHTGLAALAISAFGAVAATLVALCAGVRTGAARVLYIGMACAVPAIAFALAVSSPAATAPAICALIGFIALRQYGEALARYDPV